VCKQKFHDMVPEVRRRCFHCCLWFQSTLFLAANRTSIPDSD
jgi:hypothetical protein